MQSVLACEIQYQTKKFKKRSWTARVSTYVCACVCVRGGSCARSHGPGPGLNALALITNDIQTQGKNKTTFSERMHREYSHLQMSSKVFVARKPDCHQAPSATKRP